MSGCEGLSDLDMRLNCVLTLKMQFVEAAIERYVALAAIAGKIILPSLLP